ncbi:MAG: YheU family protein [Deltaproteobacteria bacterium]|nr:YheU family protein [Deltaproteobacteria bacterium]MBW2360628.1 YheU family protein [Deltaproteobacteria bacterium]
MDDTDDPRRGTELPVDALSPEALRGLIEDFVTRDGTDYGAVERSIDDKIRDVLRQLESGEARIVFDPEGETASITLARELSRS